MVARSQTPVYSCAKILIFFVSAPTHCGLQFTLICEFCTHEVNVFSCLSCVCPPWSWSYRQLSGAPCWCCELNLGLLEEQYTVVTLSPLSSTHEGLHLVYKDIVKSTTHKAFLSFLILLTTCVESQYPSPSLSFLNGVFYINNVTIICHHEKILL